MERKQGSCRSYDNRETTAPVRQCHCPPLDVAAPAWILNWWIQVNWIIGAIIFVPFNRDLKSWGNIRLPEPWSHAHPSASTPGRENGGPFWLPPCEITPCIQQDLQLVDSHKVRRLFSVVAKGYKITMQPEAPGLLKRSILNLCASSFLLWKTSKEIMEIPKGFQVDGCGPVCLALTSVPLSLPQLWTVVRPENPLKGTGRLGPRILTYRAGNFHGFVSGYPWLSHWINATTRVTYKNRNPLSLLTLLHRVKFHPPPQWELHNPETEEWNRSPCC